MQQHFGGAFLLALSVGTAAAQKVCPPEQCSGAGMPKCPAAKGLTSKPTPAEQQQLENLYFRNAAPYAAQLLRVDELGHEVSQ
jgi:hypothetical protein